MGTLVFEDKSYTFDWIKIVILFLGAPAFALLVWFSHDWFWLHRITADITIKLMNFLTQATSAELVNYPGTEWPWRIIIYTAAGYERGGTPIRFESLCTGVHAIAIFAGVILCTPHTLEKDTNKDIWIRKIKAIIITTTIFYVVNIFRMILQLVLYRNGSNWEDVHYPISAASSFIAVACVLLMHKFVPEFIMSLIWIGDEIREKIKPSSDEAEIEKATGEESSESQEKPLLEESQQVESSSETPPE